MHYYTLYFSAKKFEHSAPQVESPLQPIIHTHRMSELLDACKDLLTVDVNRRACTDNIRVRSPPDLDIDERATVEQQPFPFIYPRYPYLETLIKEVLDHESPNSVLWRVLDKAYDDIVGIDTFSSYVLALLMSSPETNRVRMDTFAIVFGRLRPFELDVCPATLWYALATNGFQSVPLWKAILKQYRVNEVMTGNMFLSLETSDARDYLDEPFLLDNEFIRATYCFRAI